MTEPREKIGRPLHQQMALAAIVPLILFGILAAFVSSYGLERTSLGLVLERNAALAQAEAGEVAAELFRHRCVLSTVANELAPMVDAPGELEQLLRERAPFLQHFGGGIAFLDVDGVAIATTEGHEERAGIDYSFRDYFQQVTESQQAVFSQVLREEPSGRDAIVIAAPAIHSGDLAGVLAGVIFLEDETWAERIEHLQADPGSQVYLIDEAGRVIYHSDPEHIGENIATEPALDELVRDDELHSILHKSEILGERVVASYAVLPDVGWGLIMEESWRKLVAPTRPYRWGVAGVLLLGTLLSLELVVLAVGQVVHPVRTLANAARQVADGESFRPLEVRGSSELRRMIIVFNQMVQRLEDQQTSIRQYALQVLHSQEEERNRISRDLHDETLQDLIALIMRIEFCRDTLRDDPIEAEDWLDQLEGLARTALKDVRRISEGLRPFVLDDLGLPAALKAQCRELGEDIEGEVKCALLGEERRLPQEVELTVFRVVQEALVNIRKHASSAKHVKVSLQYESDLVLATVEDDGAGFVVPALEDLAEQGHPGLAGMYERARLIGGELRIDSEPGKGMRVMLQLPAGGVETLR